MPSLTPSLAFVADKQFTALAERFARDDPSGMIPWETVWKEAPEAFGTIVMAHCEAGGECSNGLTATLLPDADPCCHQTSSFGTTDRYMPTRLGWARRARRPLSCAARRATSR